MSDHVSRFGYAPAFFNFDELNIIIIIIYYFVSTLGSMDTEG